MFFTVWRFFPMGTLFGTSSIEPEDVGVDVLLGTWRCIAPRRSIAFPQQSSRLGHLGPGGVPEGQRRWHHPAQGGLGRQVAQLGLSTRKSPWAPLREPFDAWGPRRGPTPGRGLRVPRWPWQLAALPRRMAADPRRRYAPHAEDRQHRRLARREDRDR